MPPPGSAPVEAAVDEASTDSVATDSADADGAVPDESADVENSTEPDESAHTPLSADAAADAAAGGSPEDPAMEDKPDSAGTLPKIRLFDEYR